MRSGLLFGPLSVWLGPAGAECCLAQRHRTLTAGARLEEVTVVKRLLVLVCLSLLAFPLPGAGQEVPPVEPSVGTASAVPVLGAGLTVTAWTDKPAAEIPVGDLLKVSFRTSAEAQCYVIAVGTTGKSDLLFPNKKETDNRVAADVARTIPGDPGYRIRIAGPPGKEVVIVLACTKALPVYENLSLIAPRKVAGALTMTGAVARDLTLESTTPGGATEPPVDLEPFLSELERAGHVTRGQDLAHAVMVLTVKDAIAAATPASPAASAPAAPEGGILPAVAVPLPIEEVPPTASPAPPVEPAPPAPTTP